MEKNIKLLEPKIEGEFLKTCKKEYHIGNMKIKKYHQNNYLNYYGVLMEIIEERAPHTFLTYKIVAYYILYLQKKQFIDMIQIIIN